MTTPSAVPPVSASGVVYFGVREPLRREFTKRRRDDRAARRQIVDLVGYGVPPVSTFDIDRSEPTVVLSARRSGSVDALAAEENDALALLPRAVVLRCSPLDLSIPLLWSWAHTTRLLMSAFRPEGVPWIHTADLAEAVMEIDDESVDARAGRAFDVTGPRRVPMSDIVAVMRERLGDDIELASHEPDEFASIMTRNGIPSGSARWIADYQRASSEEAAAPITPVLAALLRRPARPPRLEPFTEPETD